MAKRKRGFDDKDVNEKSEDENEIDNAAEAGAENEVDTSLTIDKELSPRERFNQAVTGNPEDEIAELLGEDSESTEDDKPTGDTEELEDKKTSDDTDNLETSDDPEDDSDTEDKDYSTDTGVDLSDLGIESETEDEETVEPDAEFDATADLSKDVWKQLPKEAKELITGHRQNSKALSKQVEANKNYADYTRSIFDSAEKAKVSDKELGNWIHAGLLANTGDKAAIEFIGSVAEKGGYKPKQAAAAAPDLSSVETYLKEQMASWDLSEELGKEIWAKVNEAVKTPAKAPAAKAPSADAPPPPQATYQAPPVSDNQGLEVENAAIARIELIAGKYQNAYGDQWDTKMKSQVRDLMVLEQAKNTLSAENWPSLYVKCVKKVEKSFLNQKKKAKGSKKPSRMKGDSDSLGAGNSLSVSDPTDSNETPRQKFNRVNVG